MSEKEEIEIVKDLKLWTKKINDMMLISTEGKAPQIFKAIIFKAMGVHWTEKFKEINKERYLEAEELMKPFTEGKIKTTRSREEAENLLYGGGNK